MVIGLDLDGCIADFNSDYAKRLIKVTGEDRLPVGWKSNQDHITTWDWDLFHGYTKDEIAATWKSIKADTLFWQKLKPLPGVVEAMARLNAVSREHNLYFLTNRLGVGCKQQSEKFLYNLGINYPTVMITSTKLPVIKALNISFFIDDKLETMNEVVADGTNNHTIGDKHFYLLDAPYNRTGRRVDLKVVSSLREALEKAGIW